MSPTTPCRTCGAPQAPDQRYCLSCGARVAAPRLDFVAEAARAEAAAQNASSPGVAAVPGAVDAPTAVLAAAAPPVAAVPIASPPAPSRLDRIGGPMGAAAVVLVALGVGFLAGQATTAAPPRQQAPVVNIEGALPGGSAATPASDLPAAEETTGDAPDEPGATGDAGTNGEVPATDDAGTTDDDGGAGRSSAAPDEAAPPPADGGSEAEAIG